MLEQILLSEITQRFVAGAIMALHDSYPETRTSVWKGPLEFANSVA